jgi:serine/threonine protein kinase
VKVLIADDDPVWRRLLSDNVRQWGHDVVTAADGQEAWDLLQESGRPRVAILDWQMPELDGLDICRRVRASLNLPFIYTIILTGRDTREDMVAGLESGADDYLVKPVDMAILRSRLTAAARIVEAVPPPRQIPGYKLLGRLGAGSMATVYKARQLSLDRLVAVKVLPKEVSDNAKFVERFYAEGRAAAKLNHPNIVAALDVGRHGEVHYFIMEYVEGYTVYEYIVQRGSYPEKRALKVAIQIANALHHAHQAGLIHRDVKPKNILITKEGVAKLADMGLARAVSDVEAAEAEAGKPCGTPYYISPEQVRGAVDIDARTDLYSFGATLYHMVTGKPAFSGPDTRTILRKHLRDRLVPPDHINAKLSRGFAEIIETCMAKDPAQRYGSAAELIQDLRAVAGGQPPVHAHRASVPAPAAESEPEPEAVEQEDAHSAPSLTTAPLFWIALAGWLLAAVLLVLLLLGNRR